MRPSPGPAQGQSNYGHTSAPLATANAHGRPSQRVSTSSTDSSMSSSQQQRTRSGGLTPGSARMTSATTPSRSGVPPRTPSMSRSSASRGVSTSRMPGFNTNDAGATPNASRASVSDRRRSMSPSPAATYASARQRKALSINPAAPPAPEPVGQPTKRLTLSVLPSPLPSGDVMYSPGFSPTSSQFSRPSSMNGDDPNASFNHAFPTPPMPDSLDAFSRHLEHHGAAPESGDQHSQVRPAEDAHAIQDLRNKVEELLAENRMLKLDSATRAVSGVLSNQEREELDVKIRDLEAQLAHATLAKDVAVAEMQVSHSKQVEALEQALSELQSALAEKSRTLNEQAETITQFQVELSSRTIMASELDDISQTISVLETEAQQKHQQAARFEAELATALQDLKAARDSFAAMERDKRRVEAESDRYKARIGVLERELQSSTSTMDEFMKMGEDRVATFGKLHGELKSKSDRIETLTMELDKRQEMLNRTQSLLDEVTATAQASAQDVQRLTSRVKELESERDAMAQARDGKASDLQKLQAQFDQVTADLIDVQTKLAKANEECAVIPQLQDEIESLRRRDDQKRVLVSSLETELGHANESKAEMEQVLADKTRQLASLDRDLSAKKQLIDQLQSEIDSVTSTASQLEHKTLSQTQQLKRLESQLEARSAALAAAENDLTDCQKKVTLLEQAVKGREGLQEKIAEMQAQFDSDKARLTQQLQNQISSLQRDLEASRTESSDLAAQLQSHLDDLSVAKALALSRAQDLGEAKHVIADMEQSLASSQARSTSLHEQLVTLRQAQEKLQDEYAQVLARNSELGSARGQLSVAEAKVQELTKHVAQQEAKNEALEKAVEDFKKQVASKDSQGSSVQARVVELEASLAEASAALIAKEQELKEMQGKVSHLKQSRRETMAQYMDSIDTLMADMMRLQAKYDEVTSKPADPNRLSTQSTPAPDSDRDEVVSNNHRMSMPVSGDSLDFSAPPRGSSRMRSQSVQGPSPRSSGASFDMKPVTVHDLPESYLHSFPGVPTSPNQLEE
ncbi:hypothetical protein BCR44DRAFT_1066593 [Catenaria anguillulae PL171]|uniref:Uncharacterized protein n=1 Tax=Catenaria anguillulae PL171 TaxID=765915 RepID=A0A1Y2HPN7_9FUNG|nr:hypothetical protein BCR44DRAFT_1066593 [Catenaria anguillulae PL171]